MNGDTRCVCVGGGVMKWWGEWIQEPVYRSLLGWGAFRNTHISTNSNGFTHMDEVNLCTFSVQFQFNSLSRGDLWGDAPAAVRGMDCRQSWSKTRRYTCVFWVRVSRVWMSPPLSTFFTFKNYFCHFSCLQLTPENVQNPSYKLVLF